MSQPEPWELADPDSYPDMNYLLTEAARVRYLIAAHHVQHCEQVVEIGGFKTPVTGFLSQVPRRVLVVDPLIRSYRASQLRGVPCQVEHVCTSFQSHRFELPQGRYGLVLLGLSLKHFSVDASSREREWNQLVALVAQSQVAVVEWALEWPPGRDSGERLLQQIDGQLILDIDLDFARSPGADTVHHRRRLVVLRPAHDSRWAEVDGRSCQLPR